MKDAVETLGTILTGEHGRDAVHVAVIPAVAAHALRPGEHIGICSDGLAAVYAETKIGVVDPFLPGPYVMQGQRFWIFIYPRQIVSLRHVWVHPLIADEGLAAAVAQSQPDKPTKEESEAWLRNFCGTHDCPDYDTVIAAASGEPPPYQGDYGRPEWEMEDDYLLFVGTDAHCDVPDEFWDHLENLKGRKLKRVPYFSCTC